MAEPTDDVLARLQPIETDQSVLSRLVPMAQATPKTAVLDVPKATWRDLAEDEIRKQNLDPTQPGHASQMVGIYDAYRKQYGSLEEQAVPDYGAQLVKQRHMDQAAANAQHGQLASLAIEALHPAGQIAALGEKILAPAVGLVSPKGASNMLESARQLQDVRGAANIGGTVGQIAGNIPTYLNPAVAMATTAEEAQHGLEQRREEGEQIGGVSGALDVAGQAALSGVMAKLFGSNATGGMAKVVEGQLTKAIPGLMAKYGARGLTGALLNVGQTLASNAISKATVSPQQELTEGAAHSALLGAGMEAGMGALHDVATALRPGPQTAQPATPTPQPTQTPTQPSGQAQPAPAARQSMLSKVGDAITAKWRGVNKFLGTGIGVTEGEQTTARDIRSALGQHERTGAMLEQELQPHRDTLQKLDPGARAQWVDQVEAGQPSPIPELQPAADLNAKLSAENIKEAEKYGINTKGWDENWIGRLFKKSDTQTPTGTTTTMGGTGGFLKARHYDTYSDAKAAAEQAGLEPVFKNEIDMMLAKQMEVRRNIMARKLMYDQENSGALKWVPENERPEEGQNVKLQDRLAQQERPLVGPKYLVKQAAEMPHFDAEKFLDDHANQFQPLRPGDQMPKNMTYTGRTQRGTFHGSDNTATMFNSQLAERTSPESISDLANSVSKWDTGMRFAFSAFHAGTTSLGNMYVGLGNAMRNMFKGEVGDAVRNLWEATPMGGYAKGKAIREQLRDPTAHPQLEQTAAEIQKTNPGLQLRQKRTMVEAKEAFDESPAKGVMKMTGAVIHSMHNFIFHDFVPNLKANLMAQSAEAMAKEGLSPGEINKRMVTAQENAQNILGQVMHSNRFQNSVMKRVMDVVMPTWRFSEGFIRHGAATVRDIGEIAGSLAKGEKPKQIMTPAIMTAAGIVAGHAALSAATQAMATYIHTGKAQLPQSAEDFISPRLGYQDDQGREKRLTLPGPAHFWSSAYDHPDKLVKNRLAGWIKGTVEAAENKDYRGTQIREEGDSMLAKAGKTALHVAKSSLPMSLYGNFSQQDTSALEKAGGFFGFRTGAQPGSEAERYAHELVLSKAPVGGRTSAEAAHSDAMTNLSAGVRSQKPGVEDEIQQAVQSGTIQPTDLKSLFKRAGEEPGLPGLLQNQELRPQELMRIWEKMTPEERNKNAPAILKRITGARASADFTLKSKLDALQTLSAGLQ